MPGQDDDVNEWAYRVGDDKLILDRNEVPKFLFNVSKDPYEMINLVNKEKDLLARLEEQFQILRAEIEADPVNRTVEHD